jgi:hypothetical protein
VYVFEYMSICVCICECMCIYMSICVCTCECKCIYMSTVCIRVWIYENVYMYVCEYRYMGMYV